MDLKTCSSGILNLVSALSRAMDMVSPLLMDHHRRTAWVAAGLGKQMQLTGEEINEIILSALLHDIGAFSLRERLDTLQFEFENPHYHACMGYNLLKDSELLEREASVILNHHTWWEPPHKDGTGGDRVPRASHLIHLADRAVVLLGGNSTLNRSLEEVLRTINSCSGTVFMPEAVEAFSELAVSRLLWPEEPDSELDRELLLMVDPHYLPPQALDLQSIAGVFARIIDYRSQYTATHSAGVAAVAEALAEHLGFSKSNCTTMRIAGYLHDLGKIAVPAEILDKSESLNTSEYYRIQDHVVHTRELLENVPELGLGIRWASEHHERLNGSGYPQHSAGREIAFGSRVVAMADTMAAITEDRPYRRGVGRAKAMLLLDRLTTEGYLDAEIFDVVREHFDELNFIRISAQTESLYDHESRIKCTVDMTREQV